MIVAEHAKIEKSANNIPFNNRKKLAVPIFGSRKLANGIIDARESAINAPLHLRRENLNVWTIRPLHS